jgi:hypothetical protein
MKVHSTRFIRRMRGGAQAQLHECDDGHCYVVKFRNNPQHARLLVNEWLGSSIFAYIEISTPKIALVSISAEFLARNPEVHIEGYGGRLAVETGQHFGSRYPGNPSAVMVFDFIPDVLLERVVNRNEFLGALVLDKWMGNLDARQAIFSRPGDGARRRRGFSASMIDQGFAFGGADWRFADSPLQGLYFRPAVYRNVRSWDDFQPWLDRVVRFPEAILEKARAKIPAEWIGGDEHALDAMLEKLISRCKRVPDLITASVSARGSAFPEWNDPRARSAQTFSS